MGPAALVLVAEMYKKKWESLICGCLWMLLIFFRTAVRAGSTRAVLTVMVCMMAVLVNLLFTYFVALTAASRRATKIICRGLLKY